MSHRLITFLGRGRLQRQQTGYDRAAYDFPDRIRVTEFFGLALTDYLEPDHLTVLGTRGSMWDVLLMSVGLDAAADKLLDQLIDAANLERVEQSQLDELTPLVTSGLGLPVRLAIIPYGRDEAEQLAILRRMADAVAPGDRVSLDVTHGFRHLPLLSVMSALYLRHARRVEIGGIYYGALDMAARDAPKPVIDLAGLLAIGDWVGALSTFDKDGDYGVFGELLNKAGVAGAAVQQLGVAAFQERASNAHLARQALASVAPAVDGGLPGIAELFAEPLARRIDWHRRGDLADWQRELARQYLARRDYLRAAVFAYEGFVTRLMDRDDDPADYWRREETFRAFEGSADGRLGHYRLLKNLRNALAHGNLPTNARVGRILRDEPCLHDTLRDLIKTLLA